jgi:eukaryotic-like serine/threonine-protein kinase
MTDIANSEFTHLAAAVHDRYRLERELGRGGMATVYLAEDLRHKRKVALKVLKPELAAVLGAERFVVEITTTAALQHPHILPLFDSGEAGGFLYYVMPFIDGETLRSKLDRERQLGIEEAVKIACDVADALHYAHTNGVVHRDIKPENILLANGRPMVADFGIALALSAAAGGRMTETGLSLGTPHYMSPEQATAEKEISARSDVYSLGSVLYEMLAGEPPHTGGSAQQIIMKIIAEPAADVTKHRRSVPANVAAAIAKSLEKVPADRFATASAFAEALTNPHFTGRSKGSTAHAATGPRRHLVPALAVALAAVTGVALWALFQPAPSPPVVRNTLALADEQAPDPSGFVAVSADGSRIVYRGWAAGSPMGGVTQLWVKMRDSLHAVPIANTEAASAVAISPDGREVVFVSEIQGTRLRKAAINGSGLTTLADGVGTGYGSVAWLDDGSIVYLSPGNRAVMRIPASGGAGTVIWSSDTVALANLVALPGARGLLLHACAPPCERGSLWALDMSSRSVREIVPGARAGHYLASGHLVYVVGGEALAVPFDLRSLEVRGRPVPVMDGVVVSGGISTYLFASTSGTVVTRRGEPRSSRQYELVWADRAGVESTIDSAFTFRVAQFAGNFGWALSPDGRRLAIGLNTNAGDDIWVKALPRGAGSRLTVGSVAETRPRWTPDGRSVLFLTDGKDSGVVMRRADGTGRDSVLVRQPVDEAAISPDGNWLVIRIGASTPLAGGRDIYARRLGVDTAFAPLIVTPFDESAFAISPDGRWIAYQSDENGRNEVFVRPFPNTTDGKWQISAAGATAPLWSRDGRELFFLSVDGMMMAVPVTSGREWSDPSPRALFRVSDAVMALAPRYYTPWDVAADGRFIFARSLASGGARDATLIVIENWTQELKSRVPR